VISESIDLVYNALRDRGYSVEVANNAMKYARKGPKDWDMPSVAACEAWIKGGMIVPKEPKEWIQGGMIVPREPSPPPTPPIPPARDYGLRGGPLLYEDFSELWAEEEAEKAAKAEAEKAEKAKKAKNAEEYQHRPRIVEVPRRPVSFEFNNYQPRHRIPDAAPTMNYYRTNLLRYSVDNLDIEYSDLTDAERKRGKTSALPRLETLKILAPKEGRTLDDPKIVDEYVQALREQYDRIRKSKEPDPVDTQPAQSLGMKQMGDTSQGLYDVAFTKGLVISAVTGAVSAAAFAGVFAGVGGLYYKFFT
jgi:hypothetical protein